jgi:hypothetical protein
LRINIPFSRPDPLVVPALLLGWLASIITILAAVLIAAVYSITNFRIVENLKE